MRTLDQLIPGEQAVIRGLKTSDLTVKLLEMGLLPGKSIRFNFTAPLGDPIAIQVSGYQLSLRRDEAQLIEIQ